MNKKNWKMYGTIVWSIICYLLAMVIMVYLRADWWQMFVFGTVAILLPLLVMMLMVRLKKLQAYYPKKGGRKGHTRARHKQHSIKEGNITSAMARKDLDELRGSKVRNE